MERLIAAAGKLPSGAVPYFQGGVDLKEGGVLLALPGLLLNGLMKCSKGFFPERKGYFRVESILLTLAFLSLLRVKTLEQTRYLDPGELGRLIGLDRIPEVKTMRQSVEVISKSGNTDDWCRELTRFWMEEDPDLAGTLYIDGHVRVYHGSQTP